MRNLYHRLGLRPAAPSWAIEAAINACADAQLRDDARVVLLTPQYRSSYDLAHSTLGEIAALRASLDLKQTRNWSSPLATDFTSPPMTSRVVALQSKISVPPKYSSTATKPPPIPTKLSKGVFRYPAVTLLVWIFIIAAGVVGFSSWVVSRNEQLKLRKPESQRTGGAVVPEQPLFTEPVQDMPPSGTVRQLTAGDLVAPLRINPTADASYLVKLVDVYSKSEAMTVFVRGGFPTEVKVPLGKFEIRYASGDKWFGYEHLFGPSTSYAKAEKTFEFRVTGNQVSGYTLTLYKVRDGNLHTSRIAARDF
jgi:hypothetical protein